MNITRVGATPWYFSVVYASPDPSKRRELWDHLREFAHTHNEPWLIAGDFNDTRTNAERSAACPETHRRAARFNDWVEDMDLIEVEFAGASHTWARGLTPETRQSARLDRALCNAEWGIRFETANAAWLLHENFKEFVVSKWDKSSPLISALHKLSADLQTWNKDMFGNIFKQKRTLLARIAGVQKLLVERKDRGLMKLEARLRRDLDEVLDREEAHWYQKSRVEWIKNGDRNTTFFHLSTIVRRWRNKIAAIKGNKGDWVFDSQSVKDIIVGYFTDLFTEEGEPESFDVPYDVFPEIPQREWESLEKPYTRMEIEFVVKNMGALKAPGPDGFQALFYQKNWELVCSSVYDMVIPVLEGKGMPANVNDTHIVLLPKIERPELPLHFRPIGLCNVTYKIITKAIVNRIKPILPLLISNTQASFVPGRQITDNIVIFQEVLHTMKRKQGGKGYMAIKIDFEKAYDRLRWSFIRDTLMQMNLPLLLINVIMECVTTSNLHVLWNGEPSQSFKPGRGIRQGDPLSPYLFVMCMERLYQTIEEAIIAKKWKPIRASRNGPLLSNLFFADDILLLAEASFYLDLDCYILYANGQTPKNGLHDIDKKARRFIWGGHDDKRCTHLLAWEVLQKPREQGGVGIRSAKQANPAFLAKLGWRTLTEPNALWSRVLRAKYCKGRCDIDMFEPKKGMSNVRRGITENAKLLCEGMRMAVGNGNQTLFWDHKWATDKPLSDLVTKPLSPDLAGATVAEMWESGFGWRWEIFSPYLQQDTLKLIQSYELKDDPDIGDLVYWQGESKGKFSIKSALRIMRHTTDTIDDVCWETIWSAPVQQRIRAFLWLSCHDRILGNLNRFKRRMADNPKCYICDAREESTLHILRDYPAAKLVWRRVGSIALLPHFFTSNLKDWITTNLNGLAGEELVDWRTSFGVAIWWIWKWRNSFVFNRKHEIPVDIGAFIQVRIDETKRSLEDLTFEVHGPRQERVETFIRWNPPLAGCYSLNCDGAAKGAPGAAGGGAIIRDCEGNFVAGLSANYGHCVAIKAEIMALIMGLELAQNLSIQQLEVQLDSMACVQILQNRELTHGDCHHHINYCRAMIQDARWIIMIKHVYREGNRVADWLANQGVAQSNRLNILQFVPVELSRILEEDRRGVALPRFVPP
ncbi:uncharacterized protein [Spinacia oleracea]|uniref:Reverse transcriptase domain-containing protein n=1 Tax=Spinacia oleracea TaxID=3562 RepID=A0ABM3QZN8_SPIOL|nr:uncharacterized protein LOC130463629 [Spinacia oleracea]